MVTPQLSIGGAEVQVVELAIRLKRRGYAVTVVSSGGPLLSQLNEAGVVHIQAPANSKHLLKVLRTAVILRRQITGMRGPVILHAHAAIPSISCWLASRAHHGTYVVSTGHGWDHKQYPKVAQILRFTSRKVIAVSGKMAKNMVQAGLPEALLNVIFNSVDIERFAMVPTEQRDQIREEWKVESTDCLFGMVANLNEERKGHRILLEAVARLKHCRMLKVVFVGDGLLRSELEEASRRLRIADRIVFAGYRSDMPAVMKALDVLVLPSLWEGLPVTIIEAMAAGRPVIATAVDGVPEAVVDGVTGLLVPPGNAEALAKALLTLMDDPEQRNRMGQAGQARAWTLFDVERMVNLVEQVYAEILRPRQG